MLVFQHVADVLVPQTPLSLHRGNAAAQIVAEHRAGFTAVPHFSSQVASICEQDAVTALHPSCASTLPTPKKPNASANDAILFIDFVPEATALESGSSACLIIGILQKTISDHAR
ncbi:hypothetical protein [Methylobacterium sp. Gmos1]